MPCFIAVLNFLFDILVCIFSIANYLHGKLVKFWSMITEIICFDILIFVCKNMDLDLDILRLTIKCFDFENSIRLISFCR